MSDINSWRNVLTADQLLRAAEWYARHRKHVLNISRCYVNGFPPTDDLDKDYPELWKAQHWAWFLRHYGATMRYLLERAKEIIK